MRKRLARAGIEIAFIIFLFYSNLLMGEFSRSGEAHGHRLAFALGDIFTGANFLIACVAGLIGYVLFDALRKRL